MLWSLLIPVQVGAGTGKFKSPVAEGKRLFPVSMESGRAVALGK